MKVNIRISRDVFNEAYLPYLDCSDRYLVFYGGGSSGKSYFIAQRWIYMMLHPALCNLLVVRNTADTNRRSTFPMLKQVISGWRLSSYFKINESDMKIKCLLTGNEIAFIGLDDVEKVKSITFAGGELTHIWVEEATECREADINQLKVRLRGGRSKKQMVLSFNPVNIRHWIKRHFIDSGLAAVCRTTYKDNKFLTDDDRRALEALKESDEYTYRVYCLGMWGILGKTVFNAAAIEGRLSVISAPLRTGYFAYSYNGLAVSDIRWVDDPSGCIRIYRTPITGSGAYCIGADTAGDGSDRFTAHVLDVVSGVQAAVLEQSFDSDMFAKQIFCLGMYYNRALVGIEANFDSYPIRELTRLGYTRQYVRRVEDSYTGRCEERFGFRTTALTRPTAISALIEIVRDHTDRINDRQTLEELLTIVRNERGRIEAPSGGHDDHMMGLAIAYEIREQAYFAPCEAERAPGRGAFEERAVISEPGQQIRII